MDNGFDVLEEKVKRTAETVKRLRQENETLQGSLAQAKPAMEQAERRATAAERKLAELEKSQGAAAEEIKKGQELTAEVSVLRKEREEIRKRIGRMVELLESLDD